MGYTSILLVRTYYVSAGLQRKSILKHTKGFVRAGASHENQSSDRGRKMLILLLFALSFPPAGLLWSSEFSKPQPARWLQETSATLRVFHTRVKLDLQWHSALLPSTAPGPDSSAAGSSDVLPCTTPGEAVQLFWALLNDTLCAYWM